MPTPANNSGIQVIAERARSSSHDIRMGEADGDDVTIGVGDKVRVKVVRGKATPLLDIVSSGGSTASTCTAANPTRLALHQSEMTFPAGLYDLEVLVVDAADSSKIKRAEKGILHVRESGGGSVS